MQNISPKEDRELQIIGLELMFYTPQKSHNSQGLTAIEISRKYNIQMDIVKKKLKILQEKNIIRSIGINPKYWQFDHYNFQRINEDDSVYLLLCCFDDVDFDQFFNF